jgi:hypothetical protein
LLSPEFLRHPYAAAVAKKYSTGEPQPASSRSRLPLVDRCFSGRKTNQQRKSSSAWLCSGGLVVIPKSANRTRIFTNADVFNFEITAENMRLLDGFNENLRTCWDPTNAP